MIILRKKIFDEGGTTVEAGTPVSEEPINPESDAQQFMADASQALSQNKQ